MAEAARTVKHYVSDCLSERHPYDVQKGFAGRNDRDKGKVFSVQLPDSIDDLIRVLTDESIADPERAKAVHYLYAASASQEMKIILLEKGIVTLIVGILRRKPFNLLEHQCLLLLTSLCIIPQGCFCVVDGGGLEMGLMSILDARNKDERESARTAAVHLVEQIAFDFAGVRWMVRVEDCDEFKLQSAKVEPAPYLMSTEDVLKGLMFVLNTEPTTSKLAIHAITALALMTAIAPVLHYSVSIGTPLDIVARLLTEMLHLDQWAGTQSIFLGQLLISIHNIAMDQKCVEALETRDVPDMLFNLLERLCASPEKLSFSVQRHAIGAISAVSKLTSVKRKAIQPLGEHPSRIIALIKYLERINDIVKEDRCEKRETHVDIVAISKNTVQTIRLLTETRPVRDVMHVFIDELEKKDSTDCFYFRRQLYCGTQWEQEYDAAL